MIPTSAKTDSVQRLNDPNAMSCPAPASTTSAVSPCTPSRSTSTPDLSRDPRPLRPPRPVSTPNMSCLGAGEEQAGGAEGACLPPEPSPEQVKIPPESTLAELPCWAAEAGVEPTSSQVTSFQPPCSTSSHHPNVCPSKAEPSQAKLCFLPSMLKLVTVTKSPPEVTAPPPTPTFSPKGCISEEAKQKLKSVILSVQLAANVQKENLCQSVPEMSSQESQFESDSDKDNYMDI